MKAERSGTSLATDTRQALDHYAAERRRLAERRDITTPQPGDVYALASTSEWFVEWAVLRRDTADPDRFLVVAADTHPFIGSADVRVPDDAPAGPLALRCRFGGWLDAGDLDPDLRTAALDAEHLEAALEKRRAIEADRLSAQPLEEEVDASPSYREWEDELIRAENVLLGEARSVPAAPVHSPPPRSGPRPSRFLALAASALVAATLSFWVGSLRHRQAVEDLVREHQAAQDASRRQIVELEDARRSLVNRHRQELDQLREEQNEAEARHRSELEALHRRAQDDREAGPLVNLPFFWLTQTNTVRGAGTPLVIELDADTDMYFLIVPVSEPQPFDRYRLEILRQRTGRLLWSNDEMVRSGITELTVALPRELLAAGVYLVRAFGLRDGAATRLEEYVLEVAEK